MRRIFELYGAGNSLKRIAKLLNAEKITSPQPQKGRLSRSWCPSSIRTMLHNDRYRGLVIYGKTRKIRSADTGRKVYRRRPQAEWTTQEFPEQRIVSDEIWNAAQARKELVKRMYDDAGKRPGLMRSSAMNSPYLFSGLLKCAECGANLQILSGRGKHGSHQRYGCPMNFARGEIVCRNGSKIRRDILERELLAGLQSKVLRDDVVAYIIDRFEEQLIKGLENIGGEMDQMKKRKADLEVEIARLVSALASGTHSPAVMTEITNREREISGISDRLLSSKPESVRSKIRSLRDDVAKRIQDIRECMNGDAGTVRAFLSKHIQRIEMDASGGTHYVASGNWDLLGTGGRWDGAEGQNRTGYAGLFRAALYQ